MGYSGVFMAMISGEESPFMLNGRTDVRVAFSLRDLYGTDPDLIRVVRSSDSAVSGFTESEITDGTLTDWVTVGLSLIHI